MHRGQALASSKLPQIHPVCFPKPLAWAPAKHFPNRIASSPRRPTAIRGIGDDLLDYIQGGPKLRKWYGEGERLPSDGGVVPERVKEPEPEEEDESKDAVLVTDADSEMGEQIVLQLILSRAKLKVLVKDALATKAAYGPYVTPIEGDLGDAKAVRAALKGVRTVILPGRLGAVVEEASKKGVEHLILLSMAGSANGKPAGPAAFLGGEALWRDPSREQAVRDSGVPFTVVRTLPVRKSSGGGLGSLLFGKRPSGGEIRGEDLGRIIADAAVETAPESQGVVLKVDADEGREKGWFLGQPVPWAT